MAVRIFNGLQINVPEGWGDFSTVIVAPQTGATPGAQPTINLVVKRRPVSTDPKASLAAYLDLLTRTFGALEGLETKELLVGDAKGTAVRFTADAEGRRFSQTTLIYQAGGEEIAATVTQTPTDPTPAKVVEKLLKSVRPVGAPMR